MHWLWTTFFLLKSTRPRPKLSEGKSHVIRRKRSQVKQVGIKHKWIEYNWITYHTVIFRGRRNWAGGQCAFCHFTFNTNGEYKEHLSGHSEAVKCKHEGCNYITTDLKKLRQWVIFFINFPLNWVYFLFMYFYLEKYGQVALSLLQTYDKTTCWEDWQDGPLWQMWQIIW